MEVVDSSVIINAALGHDRDSLEACRDAVVRSRRAIAHTLAESCSALCRSPLPFRLSPAYAWRLLDEACPLDPLTLSGGGHRRVLGLASQQAMAGGAIYGGLIAQTAVEHDATLISRD